MTLVIFVEERSMTELLKILLPQILPTDMIYKLLAYEGARDLETNLSRDMRKWTDPRAKYLVLRDNDNGDCIARKARLIEIVRGADRAEKTKIRIVCQELEAWFLGDLAAVEAAQLGAVTAALRRRAQQPDTQQKPSQLLKTAFGTYQKGIGARAIAPHMEIARNTSPSFHAFVAAVRHLAQAA